jgi:S-DNA-T family DNA segregation ATPase FtsK/SpoIIIE
VLGILIAATGGFVLAALWPWDPAVERSLAMLNLVGILGAYTAFYLYRALGFAAVVVGAGLVVWGALVFLGRGGRRVVLWSLAAGIAAVLLVTLLGVGAAWSGEDTPWAPRAGALGTAAAVGLVQTVGVAGAVLVCVVALVLLFAATFGISLATGVETGYALGRSGARGTRAGLYGLAGLLRRRPAPAPPAEEPAPGPPIPVPEPPAATRRPDREARELPASGGRISTAARSTRRSAGAPASFLPPLDLLDPVPRSEAGQGRGELDRLGEVLIEKLMSFNVEGEVVAIHTGPVLTQFEVKPAPGIKVNQIANLADDLALAMKAQRIRIVAPIPGKGVVGIEIPNPTPQLVTIREMLEAKEWSDFRGKIPLALGREIAGAPIFTDLARMPHLLIAGATGSGKSVCINAIVTSLLYRFGPDEVRLIMIDPKMLELIAYNGVPHLLHPVVVEHRESAKALKWTVAEMERRYRVLAANGVRSLQDFNERVKAGEELKGVEGEPRTIPTIVVLIDELADLMLTVQNEIEEPLARLAQMARAVGIHLVLATQRPSVNVITGVIKANFPSRLSFQVSSKIDSRTVLDMNGAEQLLGHGDMLFLPADRAEPIRIQGAYVSTAETARVVDWLVAAGETLDAASIAPPVDIIAEASELEMTALDERDELFAAAARVVVDHDQGSTSLLQRRLKVGYSRAARILDQLERAGIVGPPDGTKPREVRITPDDLDRLGNSASDA